jgi:histone deacetylase 11
MDKKIFALLIVGLSLLIIVSLFFIIWHKKRTIQEVKIEKLPIVFHPNYDISFFGLEKLHPFDTKKYGKIYKHLTTKLGILEEQFFTPTPVTDADLRLIHNPHYLATLRLSSVVAQIAELPILRWIPNFFIRWRLLKPMRYGTGGTILGTKLALKHNWAINLSGGYHHAKAELGGGFCFYADVPIALQKLWAKNPQLRCFIVDLDAHQGNGYADIFNDDERISIFDMYNKHSYPGDIQATKHVQFLYPMPSGAEDDEYLFLLEQELPQAFDKLIEENKKPDLIIYNAGTDIYEHDPLGGLKITADGIIKRDALVFKTAQKYEIPILMLLSGGYSPKSAEIIGKSIENILRNILKVID